MKVRTRWRTKAVARSMERLSAKDEAKGLIRDNLWDVEKRER